MCTVKTIRKRYSVHGFRVVLHHFIQVARDGSFQLRSGVVQSAEAGLQRDRIPGFDAFFGMLVDLFLLLLEASEIILNQESGVELAHRHLVINYGRERTHQNRFVDELKEEVSLLPGGGMI